MSIEQEKETISLIEILNEVKSHRRFLVFNTIIWIAVAVFYIMLTPNEYSAGASIVLTPARITGATQGTAVGNAVVQLDSAQAESQTQVLRSERNLRSVYSIYRDQLVGRGVSDKSSASFLEFLKGHPRPETQLVAQDNPSDAREFQRFADRVNVRRVGASYVLELTYRAASPQLAAKVANSIALQYLFSQIELKAASMERGGEFLQSRIGDIQRQRAAAKAGVENGELPSIILPDADAQIISAATAPLSKSWPANGLILAFSIVISALVSLLVIVVRSAIYPTIRSARSVRRNLGIQCTGEFKLDEPRNVEKFNGHLVALMLPKHANTRLRDYIYTIRNLAANVIGIRSGELPVINCMLPVCSGKKHAFTALAVGYSIAMSGKKVLLVDLDLDEAVLTSLLAPEAKTGLYDLAPGIETSASDLLHNVHERVRFLPARSLQLPYNPNVYGSDPFYASIVKTVSDADVIIACLPRFTSAANLQGAGAFLGSITVVLEPGSVSSHSAREMIAAIRSVGSILVGCVLIRGG